MNGTVASHFEALAAAAKHGGAEPDLLDEAAWLQTDDLWQYARRRRLHPRRRSPGGHASTRHLQRTARTASPAAHLTCAPAGTPERTTPPQAAAYGS